MDVSYYDYETSQLPLSGSQFEHATVQVSRAGGGIRTRAAPEEPQALKACPLVHSGTPALHKDQRPTDIPQAVRQTAHRRAPSAIPLMSVEDELCGTGPLQERQT